MLTFNVIPGYQDLLFGDFLWFFFRVFFFSIRPTDPTSGNAFDAERKKKGDGLTHKNKLYLWLIILLEISVSSQGFLSCLQMDWIDFEKNLQGFFYNFWCNISNMRCSVSSPDETPRRELKIRRAAEYFWQT